MADEPDELDGIQDLAALRREAASWRRKFREAETQIDTLRQRDEAGARREIERLAADRLARPDDLLLVVNLDDLRDDTTGLLDTGKAETAIAQVLQERPHFGKPEPPPPSNGHQYPDVHGGPRQPAELTPLSFGAELKAARRG